MSKNEISANYTKKLADHTDKEAIFRDPKILRSYLTVDEWSILRIILQKRAALTINEIYLEILKDLWTDQKIDVFIRDAGINFLKQISYKEYNKAIQAGLIVAGNKRIPNTIIDFRIPAENESTENNKFTKYGSGGIIITKLNEDGEQVKNYETALREMKIKFPTYKTLKEAIGELESWNIITRRKKGARSLVVIHPSWVKEHLSTYLDALE